MRALPRLLPILLGVDGLLLLVMVTLAANPGPQEDPAGRGAWQELAGRLPARGVSLPPPVSAAP